MSYIRNANPDATTSELDAKQITTVKELTDAQRSELINHYCEIVVDSMDMKSLMIYAIEQMQCDFRNDYTDDELREEINNFDEELYDELVDNVTSD